METKQIELKKETFFDFLKKLLLFYIFHFISTFLCSIFVLFLIPENKQNGLYVMLFFMIAPFVYIISIPIILLLSIKIERINYFICGGATFVPYVIFILFAQPEERMSALYNPNVGCTNLDKKFPKFLSK